jgi:hypothetical protein
MAGIVALLSTDEVFKAVSPGGIYAVLPPEGEKLVTTTYQRVGGSSGQGLNTIGLQKVRVQFDFRGPDAASCEAAHSALRNVLEQFSGQLPNQFILQNAVYMQPIDFFDSDSRRFRTACEFYLYFLNPQPINS